MTSNSTYPQHFTEIDALLREDHSYLNEGDRCYYIGEYTTPGGFAASELNRLILNFKKGMERKGRPEWRHKEKAIRTVARMFDSALVSSGVDRWTFVPIPPSKAKGSALHDDRLIRMLQGIRDNPPLNVRELVIQTSDTDPFHKSKIRLSPRKMKELYKIVGSETEPEPENIAVVDDVLTTGSHFRAMSAILSERFPRVPIVGLFIARRVFGPDKFEETTPTNP